MQDAGQRENISLPKIRIIEPDETQKNHDIPLQPDATHSLTHTTRAGAKIHFKKHIISDNPDKRRVCGSISDQHLNSNESIVLITHRVRVSAVLYDMMLTHDIAPHSTARLPGTSPRWSR